MNKMAQTEVYWDMKSPKEDLPRQKGKAWISEQGYCFVERESSRSTADATILLAHLRLAALVRLLCLRSNSWSLAYNQI